MKTSSKKNYKTTISGLVEYKRGVLVVMFDWKDLLATMIGGIIPALIKIFLL